LCFIRINGPVGGLIDDFLRQKRTIAASDECSNG
jgi:hypothetical protein